MTDPEKLALTSMDVAAQKRDELKQALGVAFPEVFAEGSIDFDQLKRVLGEWVDPSKERFGLNWPGKAECMKVIQRPSVATLKPSRDESVNFDDTENLFIEGDNLEVLKLLQKAYFGRVDLIYIDPPYNTGNDFVYSDDFSEALPAYLTISNQADSSGRLLSTNADSSGRFHSNWLSMIYPRLYLAKNLLSEVGIIFISIDENEISNLRIVCDDIFGSENFIGQVTVLCNPKGRSQDKYLANCHEYLLIYSKNPLPNGAISIPKGRDEIEGDYPLSDNGGPYRELELRNTHREFGQHNRPNLYYPFFVDKTGRVSLDNSEGAEKIYPDWDDGFQGCWTWGRDKATTDLNLVSARRVTGRWKIYRKSYAYSDGEAAKKQLKSIWTDKKYHTEKGQTAFNSLFDEKEKIFQSPKSVELIAEALRMVGKEDALLLDFFGGSGTAAHAVYEQNAQDGGARRFIAVQIPEQTAEDSVAAARGFSDIAAICRERIRRASKQVADGLLATGGKAAGVGFRAFTLAKSNFQIWDGSIEGFDDAGKQLDLHIDHIDEGSSPEDILYELLLKAGFPLTTKVQSIEMTGKKVFSIQDGALLICLDKQITPDLIDALAEANPLQVICLDEGFKGNDQLKANAVQTFKARAQAEESEIVFRTV